jgi:hypothetical protein
MMGTPDQPGVIPRLCRDLFDHVTTQASETLSFTVEVSYLEIYNEQTFDLLKEGKKGSALRIRNHKSVSQHPTPNTRLLHPWLDPLSEPKSFGDTSAHSTLVQDAWTICRRVVPVRCRELRERAAVYGEWQRGEDNRGDEDERHFESVRLPDHTITPPVLQCVLQLEPNLDGLAPRGVLGPSVADHIRSSLSS